MNNRNLAILLTGQGVAALATLRLVGPAVPDFLAKHFSRIARPGHIIHGELRDESGVIDDPVVALAADSSSVDLTFHGGLWVVEAAIECATRAGFVKADSDQPPIDTFPDSTDLFDSELQAAIPLARTEFAVRTLLAQRTAWDAWLRRRPDRAAIEGVLADRSLEHLLDPPNVAIVGVPNAGKSTLANQLFGTERSIVSPVAGTTRDWVGEEANLDGLIVRLLDTPGRHETLDPIERQAIAQSNQPIADASLVIALFDASRSFESQSHCFEMSGTRTLAVANKMDKALAQWSVEFLEARSIVPVVAKEAATVVKLVQAVRSAFGVGTRQFNAPRCWTKRQRNILESPADDSGRFSEIFASKGFAKSVDLA